MKKMLFFLLCFIFPVTVWAAAFDKEFVSVAPNEEFLVTVLETEDEQLGSDVTFWDLDLDALIALMPVAPISYSPDNGDFYISGQLIRFPDDSQVVFDDDYDELFIPLRALAEAVGMEVAWAADTATVTILFLDMVYSFTTSDTFNGMPIKIIDNRVYIPSMYLIDVIMLDTYF